MIYPHLLRSVSDGSVFSYKIKSTIVRVFNSLVKHFEAYGELRAKKLLSGKGYWM